MKRFSNVANGSPDDAAAFARVATIAGENQARVTLAGVVPGGEKGAVLDALVEDKRAALEALVSESAADVADIERVVLVGKAFVEIICEVLRNDRDLVVKPASTTERFGRRALGGMDMSLIRKCPCPVWLIRQMDPEKFRGVLVGLDYEPENAENDALNELLLELATSLALSEFADLHIVHAWNLPNESFMRSPRMSIIDEEIEAMLAELEETRRRWLAETVERSCAKHGDETFAFLKPRFHLIKGDPQNAVPECARSVGARLLVLGSVARTGVPGFTMGNTAESILSQVDCSTLTVKPEKFVSPVTLDK